MIRTRVDETEPIFGSGSYTISMTYDEMLLLSMYLALTRLGPGQWEKAAVKLMTTVEEAGGDIDIFSVSMGKIIPTFCIRDNDTGQLEHLFDSDDKLLEIIVK